MGQPTKWRKLGSPTNSSSMYRYSFFYSTGQKSGSCPWNGTSTIYMFDSIVMSRTMLFSPGYLKASFWNQALTCLGTDSALVWLLVSETHKAGRTTSYKNSPGCLSATSSKPRRPEVQTGMRAFQARFPVLPPLTWKLIPFQLQNREVSTSHPIYDSANSKSITDA